MGPLLLSPYEDNVISVVVNHFSKNVTKTTNFHVIFKKRSGTS